MKLLRFNGAVALQRRKLPRQASRRSHRSAASMEPSLCSDGNVGPVIRVARDCGASMEPSLCSDGNVGPVIRVARDCGASMEPSLCSDGNPPARDRSRKHRRSLQWSRRSAATETILISSPRVSSCRLQWSRRSAATETSHVSPPSRASRRSFNGAVALQRRKRGPARVDSRGANRASMEPSLCSDGNSMAGSHFASSSVVLQWSRRSAATETSWRSSECAARF